MSATRKTKKSTNPFQWLLLLNRHPLFMRLALFASFMYLVSAARYDLQEAEDTSICTTRDVTFKGFGDLETRQCDPILDVYRIDMDANNQTLSTNVGTAYLELSKVVNPTGSETLSQVMLECLEDDMHEIVANILNTAKYANPPLDPFPIDYKGTCKITIDEWTQSNYDGKHHTTIHQRRYVDFFFQNLNPSLCHNIIDFINTKANDCHKTGRVSLLDFGKAMLVIGLIAGGALFVGGGVICYLKINDLNCFRPFNRNRMFRSHPQALDAPRAALPPTNVEENTVAQNDIEMATVASKPTATQSEEVKEDNKVTMRL